MAQALGTEAGRAAAAEKRDLLERLLARLAHEIRNPLSSLDVHVQLLEEDLGNMAPRLREHFSPRLEIIHGELHRLENIMDHFLRLAGPSALELEQVDIRKTITHVCELLRPEAGARQIEIVTRFQEHLPELRADSVRLTQALMNVMINALQAVEQKGCIEVEAGFHDERVIVVVRDNGPGIPPEKLASIFDPYFTTKAEGSGLGLWIAQQIINAHSGTVKAVNGPAGGAIFTLTLPLKPAGSPQVNPAEAPAA